MSENDIVSNEKGELENDYPLFDEELLDEEFNDGYDEGYDDASEEVTSGSRSESNDTNKSETIAQKTTDTAIFQKREDTRSRLAIIYTVLTFIVFFAGMLISVLDGLSRGVSIIDNLEVVIPLISGVFLGTLGFVLGYYFRKGEEEN